MATNKNKQIVNRKEFQMMTPSPTASVAGSFIIKDCLGIKRTSILVTSASAHYVYSVVDDAWLQIPSAALTGTFGAGSCGTWTCWSNILTATGGTTSSLTLTTTIDDLCVGENIIFRSGTNLGKEVTVTSVKINPSDASFTINFSPTLSNAVTTETFQVSTGLYWMICAASNASGSMKTYDPLTGVITTVSTAPASLGTDAKVTSTPSYVNNAYNIRSTATAGSASSLTDSTLSVKVNRYKNFWIYIESGTGAGQVRKIASNTATVFTVSSNWTTTPDATSKYRVMGAYSMGVATSGASTTITDTGKSWTASGWINYQVRIVAGTGIGQVRTITANTSTALTVATWTTTPDSTSVYVIEANDDYLYCAGNAAVTLYRYSQAGTAWSTLSPTAARSGAPGAGMSLNWMGIVDMDTWCDETNCLNGKYIYSFRGGGASTLDRFDISAVTWLSAIAYKGATETFTTGSAYDVSKGRIYIRKDATNRFFYYCVAGNHIAPLSTNTYPDGTALVGDKLFTVAYSEIDAYGNPTGDEIEWIYSLMNTGSILHRLMIIPNSSGLF